MNEFLCALCGEISGPERESDPPRRLHFLPLLLPIWHPKRQKPFANPRVPLALPVMWAGC